MTSATIVSLRTGDRDAVAIGNLCAKAKGSMVDSVKYLIEAGKKLIDKKESLDHGEWMPWLKENADALGFRGKNTAANLMTAATIKIPVNGEFSEVEASQISNSVWGNTPKASTSKSKLVTRRWWRRRSQGSLAGLAMGEIVGERSRCAADLACDIVRLLVAAGQSADPKTLAKKHPISHVTSRKSHRHRARRAKGA